MVCITVSQMFYCQNQPQTIVLKNINRADRSMPIILIEISHMECTKSKNCQQKTDQQFLFSKVIFKQGITENKRRNLQKRDETCIKERSSLTSSRSQLPICIETISKRGSQKLVYLESINHNFQKHTVVTIKKLTKNIDLSFSYNHIHILAHRMWNIFLTSGLKSKQILVILFGAANMTDQKYKELLRRCYFGQLCSQEQQTIRSAQNLLRQIALSLLSEERIRKNIQECRHIKNRDVFYHYFMEFIQTLKKGPLLKFRISKHTSQRIIQRMNANPDIFSNKDHKRMRSRLRKMK